MPTGLLLLTALAASAAGAAAGRSLPRLWLGATLAGAGAALAAAFGVLGGGAAWQWRSAWTLGGEPVHLGLDATSGLFLALLAVVGAAGAVYSREYWGQRAHPRSAAAGRTAWSALLLSLGSVLLARNGLHFLMAWELFGVSSFFLITLDRGSGPARRAGWLYLAASHASTLCLFALFASLAARTGSWELGPVRGQAGLAPLFWLALVGFGLKAGLFPLHVWLPDAHANAPSHVSAFMSGVSLKIGIYGLLRFSGWLPVPAAGAWVLAGMGVASAVLGVVFALAQHDLKRLLAYHSVENIGIIAMGLGFALVAAGRGDARWGWLALAGGLLHVWNHGLFKALLFLGSGSVLHATGTRQMSRMGGLWRPMPWTAAFFALGAAAISGLPPLNGFVSEWLVYVGLLDAVQAQGRSALGAVPAIILLAVTGALALACFVKVCGVVFLGAPRSPDALGPRVHDGGRLQLGPMAGLAAGCAAIGLAPTLFVRAVGRVVGEWNPAWAGLGAPASLGSIGLVNGALALVAAAAGCLLWRRVRRVGVGCGPTWACGYAAPTGRMQVSAGSAAAILTGWFAWILRPVVDRTGPWGGGDGGGQSAGGAILFPGRIGIEGHTPDVVLGSVVEPAGGLVMGLARFARRFQHGRVQAYLAYILAGVAALGALMQ